jgi:ATP-dependent helicase/nuclease subunit A
MTVHASKGLEAPIVFLPDTILSTAPRSLQFLWPSNSGEEKGKQLPLPLWRVPNEAPCALFQSAQERKKEKDKAEYARLLYVALTRAKNQVYIYGARGEKSQSYSWYDWIQSGIKKNEDIIETKEGIWVHHSEPKILSAVKDDKTSSKTKNKTEKETAPIHPPPWLFRAPKPERLPQQIQASQLIAYDPFSTPEEDRVLSPLQGRTGSDGTSHIFRRGLATHKLFEMLPKIADQDARDKIAKDYLAQKNLGLSPALQSSIFDEVMTILKDKRLRALFSPLAQTECAIIGYLADGRLVSGQIDRMIIQNKTIQILDYKTNRPSPQDIENIPKNYIQQLRAYAELMAHIYPDHQIETGLLWTDQARFMMIPSAYLTDPNFGA